MLPLSISLFLSLLSFCLSICLSLFSPSGDRIPQYLCVDYLFLHQVLSVCLSLAFLFLRRPISSIFICRLPISPPGFLFLSVWSVSACLSDSRFSLSPETDFLNMWMGLLENAHSESPVHNPLDEKAGHYLLVCSRRRHRRRHHPAPNTKFIESVRGYSVRG